jgi:hypothetical protein
MHRPLMSLALACVSPLLFGCQQKLEFHALPVANAGFEDAAEKIGVSKWIYRQHAGPTAYDIGVDTQDPGEGKASFRIHRTQQQVFGSISQIVALPDAVGKTLRLHAKVKTADVTGGQWMLTMSFLGTSSGIVEQKRSSGVDGTTGWHDLSVEAVIPQRANRVNIAASLGGDGTAWLDDVRLEISQ